MSDDSERDDPVLVRPYITTRPADGSAANDDRPAQIWPVTADLPADGTRETATVPASVAAGTDPADWNTALRRQRLRVLAGVGVIAVLVGGLLLAVLGPPGDNDQPATTRAAPPATAVTGAPGPTPVASGTDSSPAPTSRGASRPAATTIATAANPVPGGPARNATTGPAAGAPSPTLAPPPDPARTGPITATGGRCLSLGGLLGIDGSPVKTAACNGAGNQRWTLATDGTLRVSDRCARGSADATVRIGGCDTEPATQWRAGPGGSLVNLATGGCLTDPGSPGATVTVTDCTGAADQRWTLPQGS
jgi:hypothetical protein